MTLYIPAHFRVDDAEALLAFMQRHAFATIVSGSPDGLQVSHVPLMPERGPDGTLRLLGHVARANPHWRSLEAAAEVLAIFQGPHAYVSPGWYENHPAVPTWNYAVVHARGRVRLTDEAELHALLLELSAKYEMRRDKPWRLGDQPAPFVHGMLENIVGFELAVERLEGKFKLSQNRPAEIGRVIEGLERDGEEELAALMRAHLARA